VNPNISPVVCLEFESAKTRSLQWIPLAVRHKLDGAGLKLTLNQWQSLTLATRVDLLRLLPAHGFIEAALNAGAFGAGARQGTVEMDEVEVARLLTFTHQEAVRWLASSTSFARYALRKRRKAVFFLS